MKPFFSIIIPTLNEEKLLPDLLTDLAHQKNRDFETIIVDGHSTDKTVLVANGFKKKLALLRVVTSDKANLCYQRNLGAEKSLGSYLVFLDADIRIFPTFLYEIHKKIKSSGALFLTTYQLPDVNDQFDIFLMQLANYTLELLKLINKQMAPGYNIIVHRDKFKLIKGFDEKTTFSEDHDLSMRLYKKGVELIIIPKRLLKWSFRRMKKHGPLPIIMKYAFATLYSIIFGKITDKDFGYPMGGAYFSEALSKTNFNLKGDLHKYFLKIQKTFKKLFVE